MDESGEGYIGQKFSKVGVEEGNKVGVMEETSIMKDYV